MAITIRVDTGKPYHTQRNNEIRAHRTCASTAMAMALRYAGYGEELNVARGQMQYEDFITDFIHSDPRVIQYWQFNHAKWIRDTYKKYVEWTEGKLHEKYVLFGNEIHDVMAFAVNTLLGHTVVKFHDRTPVEDIVWNIRTGGSATLSGTFPFGESIIHHIVALAGFITNQEDIYEGNDASHVRFEDITHFIIDDPYGDYRQRYTVFDGNDVLMPIDDVISILKEAGNPKVKRALLVKPKVKFPLELKP